MDSWPSGILRFVEPTSRVYDPVCTYQERWNASSLFSRRRVARRVWICFLADTIARSRLEDTAHRAIVQSSRASPDPPVNSCPCRDGRDFVETLPLPATRSRPSCFLRRPPKKAHLPGPILWMGTRLAALPLGIRGVSSGVEGHPDLFEQSAPMTGLSASSRGAKRLRDVRCLTASSGICEGCPARG
jgi:hypothetical protein